MPQGITVFFCLFVAGSLFSCTDGHYGRFYAPADPVVLTEDEVRSENEFRSLHGEKLLEVEEYPVYDNPNRYYVEKKYSPEEAILSGKPSDSSFLWSKNQDGNIYVEQFNGLLYIYRREINITKITNYHIVLFGIFNSKSTLRNFRYQIFPLISYSEFPTQWYDYGALLYRHQSRDRGYYDQGLLSLLWTAQGHHNELGHRDQFDLLPWGLLYHQESSSSNWEFSILKNLYRQGQNDKHQSCGTILYFFSWGD